MSIKVFISYSHSDKEYKDSLEEHLIMLKRNSIINTWSDRNISPGSDWENDIQSSLDDADIILCLISSSFLASDFCYKREFIDSLEKHKNGKCRIIPIIIRTCDWKNSPIGKIQGLPEDGKPIKSWDDTDKAWLNVVDGIQVAIKELKNSNRSQNGVNISNSFNHFLSDTTIPLYDTNHTLVSFNEIYVCPDLQSSDLNGKRNKVDTDSLLTKGKYIILGDEQSGKTSFLKWLFNKNLDYKRKPIFLNFLDIKKINDIDNLIRAKFIETYSCELPEKDELVILLDNFDKLTNFNLNAKKKFISYINCKFDYIIITFDISNLYFKEEFDCFDDYVEIKLKNFGFEKREEIIKKWYLHGVEDIIPEEELYRKIDEAKDKINSILLRNILPSKPMYILLILSLLDSKSNIELTSYGHCYQQLIYQSFDNVNIEKSDFDKYINVLKEISWDFFLKNDKMNDSEITNFFINYGSEYLAVDKNKILDKLIKAHILKLENGIFRFKYSYIYYFFIGKKISESYLNDNLVKRKVDEIFENLYRDDYAAILVFINHHTREPWLNKRIVGVLKVLFKELPEADLSLSSLKFMQNFYDNIPQLIIEHKNDIEGARKIKNKRLDLLEENEVLNKKDKACKSEEDYDHPLLVKNIQTLFKGMEVVGQIIRNRHSSIKKNELSIIINESISAGLRFLNYFIQVSDVTKNRAVDFIAKLIEKDKNYTDSKIRKEVEYFYLFLTYKIIYGILKSIGFSIGSKEAMELYKILVDEKDNIAMDLIYEDISLSFSKRVYIPELERLKSKLEKNNIASLILKEMMIYHLEMFPVEYRDKQKIASILELPIKGINKLISSKKK